MRRLNSVIGCLVLGLSLFTGCSVETKASDIICIAKQTDICTDCEVPAGDTRTYRGRHTCSDDGKSFGACTQCAPVTPDDEEPPSKTTDFEPVKSNPTAVPIDATCNGKFTIVAGRDDSESQSISVALLIEGALKVFQSDGAPMRSPGTFITNGRSLVGVYRSKGDSVVTSTFSDGIWTKPAPLAGVKTDTAPAIANWGTKNKVIFHSKNGFYNEVDWDPSTQWGTSLVVVPPQEIPTKGTTAPSAVAVGTPNLQGGAIILGFADDEGGLYRQEWNGTIWKPAMKAQIVSAPIPTTLIPLAGGTQDLVSAFVNDKEELYAAARSVRDSGISWSVPERIGDAEPFDGANGVGLLNGRALLVYRDAEKKGWFTVYDPKKNPKWTEPAPLVKDANPVLASLPQLARDNCGADASLAYAEDGGKVGLMRFKNDAWEGPFKIDGMEKMTYAGVAMVP